MHALGWSMDVKACAESVGRALTTVRDKVYAAEVAEAVPGIRNTLSGYFSQFLAILGIATLTWLVPQA